MIFPPLIEFVPFAGYQGGSIGAPFGVILFVHTLTDLWLANFVLFGSRSHPVARVDARRVWLTFMALLAALLTKVVFLRLTPIWISAFAMINFVWHDLVYVLPICAVRALWRTRSDRISAAVRIMAVAALAFLPVAAWAHLVEPYRLEVESFHVPLDARRAGRAPLRVAVVADLQTDHVGAYEREAIDRVLAERPDLILLPGDLFHGTPPVFAREKDALRAELARLDAPGGVWFVRGDVDPDEYVTALLEGTRIRVLDDEFVRVKVKDREITIAGLSEFQPRATTCARDVDALPGDGDIRIVFCHHPDEALLLPAGTRVDLVVAGHTHGGQIVIPGFGPPITLSSVPRAVAAGGLHDLKSRRIFVSRGIGMERCQAPRIRMFCRPHVAVLELASADEALTGSR